jgi:hypothetical protein
MECENFGASGRKVMATAAEAMIGDNFLKQGRGWQGSGVLSAGAPFHQVAAAPRRPPVIAGGAFSLPGAVAARRFPRELRLEVVSFRLR